MWSEVWNMSIIDLIKYQFVLDCVSWVKMGLPIIVGFTVGSIFFRTLFKRK